MTLHKGLVKRNRTYYIGNMSQDRRFELRTTAEWLAKLDSWCNEQPDSPSRSVAVRRLVEVGLDVEAKEWPPRVLVVAKTGADK